MSNHSPEEWERLEAQVVRLREALRAYYDKCQEGHQHEPERIDPTGLACSRCRQARAALSTPDPVVEAMARVVEAADAWATAPVLTDLSVPMPKEQQRLCASILALRRARGCGR
jgi:hypothetical protein